MLITEEYRGLNAELHARPGIEYGVTAPRHMETITGIAQGIKARTILDYGSGPRKHLEYSIGKLFKVASYDPCIPGLADEPSPADLLVSCDVLEHIEPELLSAVLDHMAENTLKAAFVTIALREAKKFLADGRNAHLIVKPVRWWMPLLFDRWNVTHFWATNRELAVVMEAK